MRGLIKPRIVVVRSLPGLGDLLCCVPALRALRTAFPDSHIALIGLPNTQQFVQRFHSYVDELLPFPGFPGIPEVPFNLKRFNRFISTIQALKFDLALQLHGNGSRTNQFVALLGAQFNAGFYPIGGNCPNPDTFLPYPETEPEVCRPLRLLEFLGIPPQGTHLEFPIQEWDWQDWNAIATTFRLSSRYICIHPGASVAERQWHPRHFARIAEEFAARGLQVVLTGTADEVGVTQAVTQAMQSTPINLAGRTNLGSLAILLKGAQLLVCNDTGVSHLADALQVKSVVIFSNSDPQRWAPLDQQRHRVVLVSEAERSCSEQPLDVTHSIAQVVTESLRLLEQEMMYAS